MNGGFRYDSPPLHIEVALVTDINFGDVGSDGLHCRRAACANLICLHGWPKDSNPAIEKVQLADER